MSPESPNIVLSFPQSRNKSQAPGDVLAELRAALQDAPMNKSAAPIQSGEAIAEADNQAAIGDGNLQISEGAATRQYIQGNNNIQISGAQVMLRLHLRVQR